jgi:hypothetical protein
MKANFLKIAVTSLSLVMTILVLINPIKAQQENTGNVQQSDQLTAQHNQRDAQQDHYNSQNKQHGEQRKNIEAQRIAFITQQLDLTPDEAKVFWPVYNEYENKRHELKKSFREADNLHKDEIAKLTEKEATQILDNQIIEAQKFLDLRKEYHSKFKSVLPAVKVLQLYDAEREFQKMLIDKLRQHNKPNPPTNKK